MNLETLALRWTPKAERAEATRTGDRSIHLVIIGADVEPIDADRLASLMSYRLARHGVTCSVEARNPPEVPSPYGPGPDVIAMRRTKLDRDVLEALRVCPISLNQLRYLMPRTRKRSLENSLARLEVAGDVEAIDGSPKRFGLVGSPVLP